MAKGRYDLRNTLNDLTGSEWKFATRSVISKIYPVNMQHKLRSAHGGQKPPELCADIIKIFTKKNELVLDPFMGVGGSLLGASLVDRNSVGIDINPRWIDIYKQVCKLENLKEQITYCGDSLKVLNKIDDETFDFILTDVPYWNIDTLAKTRASKIRQSKLNNFENQPRIQTKKEWLNYVSKILTKAVKKLKKGKYMAIFIGDIYRENQYHCLSGELAIKLSSIKGINLKANLIWVDNSKSLHIFGYPTSFIPSMIHQNILIFRKEE